MLVTRWNKNGKKVTCESGQLKIMAENGYEFKECPEVKPKAKPKAKPKTKVAVKPKAKIEEKPKNAEKKDEVKSTPDIVLE